MSGDDVLSLAPVREAMAQIDIAPRVNPNAPITPDRVFFPGGHRGVLDIRRQLVVGNRGMGKSFWTHALVNGDVRKQLALNYKFPALASAQVAIGFNGSVKRVGHTPTIEDIDQACRMNCAPELIWRTAILQAIRGLRSGSPVQQFAEALAQTKENPGSYTSELSAIDDEQHAADRSILIVFDALDRLGHEWQRIRELTQGLLVTVLGLQSFQQIRAKVFMRVDQYADDAMFQFPDSSKIRSDHVALAWLPAELYGLLLFELLRDTKAKPVLEELAHKLNPQLLLPLDGKSSGDAESQRQLISALAGEFMGKGPKRGRVYSWVPLHLGDALSNCSPRTFLTAWRSAAEHVPTPVRLAVDYLGLSEGVRAASGARLEELREDYWWIDLALNPLRGACVPLAKDELFALWSEAKVTEQIIESAQAKLPPIGIGVGQSPDALLRSMVSIAVMEERANGKINVPDIFRVQSGILRKGGVAMPRPR